MISIQSSCMVPNSGNSVKVKKSDVVTVGVNMI